MSIYEPGNESSSDTKSAGILTDLEIPNGQSLEEYTSVAEATQSMVFCYCNLNGPRYSFCTNILKDPLKIIKPDIISIGIDAGNAL